MKISTSGPLRMALWVDAGPHPLLSSSSSMRIWSSCAPLVLQVTVTPIFLLPHLGSDSSTASVSEWLSNALSECWRVLTESIGVPYCTIDRLCPIFFSNVLHSDFIFPLDLSSCILYSHLPFCCLPFVWPGWLRTGEGKASWMQGSPFELESLLSLRSCICSLYAYSLLFGCWWSFKLFLTDCLVFTHFPHNLMETNSSTSSFIKLDRLTATTSITRSGPKNILRKKMDGGEDLGTRPQFIIWSWIRRGTRTRRRRRAERHCGASLRAHPHPLNL